MAREGEQSRDRHKGPLAPLAPERPRPVPGGDLAILTDGGVVSSEAAPWSVSLLEDSSDSGYPL